MKIVLLILAIFVITSFVLSLIVLATYTRSFSDLITVILTRRRHKRYQREMKQAHIHRVPAPMLGTQICTRKPEIAPDDYSHMFTDF